jgi:hypothetical protein
VFLDESGRRRHLVRVGGLLAGLLSAGWLAALVTGAIGFGRLPLIHQLGPIVVAAPIAAAPARADRVRRHPRWTAPSRLGLGRAPPALDASRRPVRSRDLRSPAR